MILPSSWREGQGYPTETAKMKVMRGARLPTAAANVVDVKAKLSIYKFWNNDPLQLRYYIYIVALIMFLQINQGIINRTKCLQLTQIAHKEMFAEVLPKSALSCFSWL